MKKNHLKRRLKDGEVVVGATVFEWTRPSIARILDLAGFDFLFLEYEHTYLNEESMSNIILAARDVDLPVVVKVPSLHRHFISRALDAGAMGIQLPRTNTREDVDKMVQFAKFPPIGDRAGCPGLGNTDFRPVPAQEFFKNSNDETLIVAHIETQEGMANIDHILDNSHIDVIFIGPYDLAASLGIPGELDHPKMLTNIDRMIEIARDRRIAPGIYVSNFETGQMWIERGMQFIESISDIAMVLEKGTELMTQFHNYLNVTNK